MNIGTSPSGKAAGFGPAISEVRILPSQILKDPKGSFFVRKDECIFLSGTISVFFELICF